MSPDTPQTSFRRTVTRRGTLYRPVSVPRILLKNPSNPPSPPPERRTGLKLRRTKSRCKLKRGSDQKSGHDKFNGYKYRHSGLSIHSKNRNFYNHRDFKSPVSYIKDRADELGIHQPNGNGDFLISKRDQNEGTHILKIRQSSGRLKTSRSNETLKTPPLRPGIGQTLSNICPARYLHISTETPASESGTNVVRLQLHTSTKEANLDNELDISQPCSEIRDKDGREFNYLGEERGGKEWADRLPVFPITARDIQLFIDPGRDQRAKLERFLKGDSIVQPNKSQKLPKVYQHTQKIRHKANEEYNFPPLGRDTSPSFTPQIESPQTKRKTPTTSSAVSISVETTASECFPSSPKTQYGTTLLRRPTTGQTRPIEEESEVFEDFAKRIDLKPLLIDDSPSKTLKFYTFHYPLLLEKLSEEDRDKYVDRRSVTPSLGPDLRKRGAEIRKRQLISNKVLDELEKENADCYFNTELRDLTFDPRKWPFNLTRYT